MYNEVRIKNDENIDFNITPEKVTIWNLITKGIFTKTLIPFYLISLVATRIVIYIWG